MKRAYVLLDFEGQACGFGRYEGAYAITHESAILELQAVLPEIFNAGYDEITLNTPHVLGMKYLELPKDMNIRVIHGEFNKCILTEGLDSSFDFAVMLGQHAMAGGKEKGVNRHTILPHPFSRHYSALEGVFINDLAVGEIGIFCTIAGMHNVPVIYLSGDDSACEEIKELIPNVETTAVKHSINYFTANSMTPHDAAKASGFGIKQALSHLQDIKPFKIEGPVAISVSYLFPQRATAGLSLMPGSYLKNANTLSKEFASIKEFEDEFGTIRGDEAPDWQKDIGIKHVRGFFTRLGYEPYEPGKEKIEKI